MWLYRPPHEQLYRPSHAQLYPPGNWAASQMELRYNEVERARAIYERYVKCLPSVKAWVRYARSEMKNGERSVAQHSAPALGASLWAPRAQSRVAWNPGAVAGSGCWLLPGCLLACLLAGWLAACLPACLPACWEWGLWRSLPANNAVRAAGGSAFGCMPGLGAC